MSWKENVRHVTPYTPGEQPKNTDVVKLNTNENPYPPAPAVAEALRDIADGYEILRKYPDPDSGLLTNALADYYDVDPDRIFVGVGSDDVLAMAFQTFFDSGKPVLFPDITYSFYRVWCELFRIPYSLIPLNDDFRIDPERFCIPNGGIVIANPNAPTSIALDTASIETIIRSNPESVVIVDEAYIDFGGSSMLPFVNKYDNLLIVQTFSKSRSMAGARIGMAFGQPELISCLKDVKFSFNSYTMSQDVQRTGAASLSDREYFSETVLRIINTRNAAADRLKSFGFSCPESAANFLFVTHDRLPAKEIFEALRARNIFVRYFAQDRIDNYLRITVGTPEEMEKLYSALSDITK